MTNWSIVKIPATATPNLVFVSNISAAASEKTVKDFFQFCGKIQEFELQKEGDDRQVALVLFERESAAKTACMLTNAMIVDSQISVRHYFEDSEASGENIPQENKPKVTVLAEILSAGYSLQDQIIEKGLEIDAKYGLVGMIQSYVEAAKAQAKNLDEKFHVTAKATELDNKYHVQDRVNAAVGQGIDYSNQALQTAPGQKVAVVAAQVKEQIAAVHYEAKRLQDEKKAKAAAAAAASTEAPAS
ncbi:hypothetical protein BGZ59_006132 [Podila verticillata]|nr:hypothetical protein BGZ59_006132 [Podila verticillata]KAI9231962.1 MAG: hypothetical protein BYD32DRAFT_429536 [Podila humilis]KFH67803.1 hypothetical protein MVEG_06535 [Podila verticillata NRRL 6337]